MPSLKSRLGLLVILAVVLLLSLLDSPSQP